MGNVKIVSTIGNFDAKIETLSGKAEPRKVNGKEIVMKPEGTPKITYRNTAGEKLSFCRVKNGSPLVNANGESEALSNGYISPKGVLEPQPLPFYETIDGEFLPAPKNEKTDVFEIVKWEPLSNFTDKYIVDNYYQVSPSHGKSKKDYQRVASVNANTNEMKKVFDYMISNKVVGRGILNVTSAGYLPTIAYLRPVDMGNQWTLEIGLFKQQKRYLWVEEKDYQPKEVMVEPNTQAVPSIDEI